MWPRSNNSFMCRYRNVSTSVRMCEPSTSASVMTMMRWYRSDSMSNSSPMPVPIAVIMAWISLFDSTLLMRFFSLLMILPLSGRIALDDEELGRLGVANRAIGELARQRRAVERGLAPRQLARLACREPCAHRSDRLVRDRARVGRVLLEELREPRVDGRLHEALDAWVAELRLRLPLELRVAELDGHDGREAFAHILPFELL